MIPFMQISRIEHTKLLWEKLNYLFLGEAEGNVDYKQQKGIYREDGNVPYILQHFIMKAF